jgi:ABC-type Fe3+-siderophore transport system permease subunit
VEPFDFESDERAVKAREEYKSLSPAPVRGRSDYPAHRSENGQSLSQTIIMIVVGIILVILLVLFARWLYHKVHHSSSSTTSTNNQPAQPYTAPPKQSGAVSQPSPSNNSNSGTANNQTGGLPNSGPGNVAAIFAGSALAAAGLHYIISLRRFNKNGL